MPVLPGDDRGVADAVAVLRSGSPIAIPPPSPFAYVICGTDPAAVNLAKKRPAGQSVGVSVAHLDVIAGHLDVADAVVDQVSWLCAAEAVSLLVPVRADAPGWLAPATSDGLVFFSATPWLPAVRPIIAEFGHLYTTSANISGRPPTLTADQASAELGGDLLVLDCDAQRDPSIEHGSTTMVRVGGDGGLSLVRPGINDRRSGMDPTAYVGDLARRWEAQQRRSIPR